MKQQIIKLSKEETKIFLENNNVFFSYQTSFKYCFGIKDNNDNIIAVASLGVPLSTTLRYNLFGYENRNNIVQFTTLFIKPGYNIIASYFISTIIKKIPYKIVIASTEQPSIIFPASNFKFYGKKEHKYRYIFLKTDQLWLLFTEKILKAPKKLYPTIKGYKRCKSCLKSFKLEEYPFTVIKTRHYYRSVCKICYNLKKRKTEQKYRKTEVFKIKNRQYKKTDKYKLSSRKYEQKRKQTDILFVLKKNLRGRVRDIIKKRSFNKTKKLIQYLGCSITHFNTHIEKLFKPGMSWNNYGFGQGKWNIDHIIPLSSAKTVEDMYKLAHYTNLQPLWHEENQKKTNKIQ